MKRSESIVTTPEPARGVSSSVCVCVYVCDRAVGRRHAVSGARIINVIDQLLCRCQTIHQAVSIIVNSFTPAAHVGADYRSPGYIYQHYIIIIIIIAIYEMCH